jgi:hypothetical protein
VTYNKKVIIMGTAAAVLALIYIMSLVFDPGRRQARNAAYAWLDPALADQTDRIEISAWDGVLVLVLRNGSWFVLGEGGTEYPAKDQRVRDFLALLSARRNYPVRASSAASHERLGLGEVPSFRIRVLGGAGLPLLDLLAGNADNTGRERYLRKAGRNEVRSGEDVFSSYLSISPVSWYNLRFFPADLDPGLVQRLSLYRKGEEPVIFTRNNGDWNISGPVGAARADAESYVRNVLNTEGENFAGSGAPPLDYGRIVLEFGDGSVRGISISAADESGRRYASTGGALPYICVLPGWAADRLFPPWLL